jgi:hypothetical protein
MAMDPLLMAQLQAAQRPQADPEHVRRIPRPISDQATKRVQPNDPRIQPPEEDTGPVVVKHKPDLAMMAPETQAAPTVAGQDRRAVLSFGPREGQVIIAVERAPTWDVEEGESWVVPVSGLLDFMPVLKAFTRVKDLTGGAWHPSTGDR